MRSELRLTITTVSRSSCLYNMNFSHHHSKNQLVASIRQSTECHVLSSALLLEVANNNRADLTGSLILQALSFKESQVELTTFGLIRPHILSLTTTLASLAGRLLISVIPTSKLQSSSRRLHYPQQRRLIKRFINSGPQQRTIDSKTATLSTSTGCKKNPMETSNGTMFKEDHSKGQQAV